MLNRFCIRSCLPPCGGYITTLKIVNDYRRKIIDNLVTKVFVGDDYITTHFTLGNAAAVESVRLEETKKALEHIYSVQTQSPLARQ